MIHILENPHLQLQIDPVQACWSVQPRQGGLALEGVRMGLAFNLGRSHRQTLARWDVESISSLAVETSPHGPMSQVSLALAADRAGLRCTLDFALPDEHPLLLWRMAVRNDGPHPVHLERLTLLDTTIGQRVTGGASWALFANGWQSWSYAGTYRPTERFRRTRLGPIRTPTDVNAGTPQPRRPGHFTSDMFAVLGDLRTRRAILAGFLSQFQHFGSLEARLDQPEPLLRMWANGDSARLDPGVSLSTDLACLHFLDIDSPDPLGAYVKAVARQTGIDGRRSAVNGQQIPTGWCSWYQFSSEETYVGALTAEDIRENLAAIARLKSDVPLEVIQIDDGFEAQIGDWLAFDPGFPEGVAPLAAEIRQAGFTPGLWLAPYIVHPKSRLAREHPAWLLRGQFNRPVNAGLLWNTFATALDLTHPEVLEYTTQVMRTAVHEWGFPYIKLDFLYAAALPGRYRDSTRTRAQVLRLGLEALREAAGEGAFLLGCGCPLGSALGLVDAMRINADVARRWKPSFSGIEFFFEAEPNLPSARNAAHNSLTRAALHRRWWLNDPDCLLLRPETHLTLDEVRGMATVIAMTGGSMLLSDHLPALPPERLHIAQALLPPLDRRPRLPDWFDSATPARLRLDLENESGVWHLLALFNWADQTQETILRLEEYQLEAGEYWAREFWSSRVRRLSGNELVLGPLPAHGAALLAVRRVAPDQSQYLGSDLYISQGLEVTAWTWDPVARALRLRLERPGRAQGRIDLALPAPPEEATLNGAPLAWTALEAGCYRFIVEFEESAQVQVIVGTS